VKIEKAKYKKNHDLKRNFTISQFIEINVGDRCFDMHNDFDLLHLRVAFDGGAVFLEFEHTAAEYKGGRLVFSFSGVRNLSIGVRDAAYPASSDRTLEYIGFADELTEGDEFIEDDAAGPEMDLKFGFESKMHIRIGSDEAIAQYIAVN